MLGNYLFNLPSVFQWSMSMYKGRLYVWCVCLIQSNGICTNTVFVRMSMYWCWLIRSTVDLWHQLALALPYESKRSLFIPACCWCGRSDFCDIAAGTALIAAKLMRCALCNQENRKKPRSEAASRVLSLSDCRVWMWEGQPAVPKHWQHCHTALQLAVAVQWVSEWHLWFNQLLAATNWLSEHLWCSINWAFPAVR